MEIEVDPKSVKDGIRMMAKVARKSAKVTKQAINAAVKKTKKDAIRQVAADNKIAQKHIRVTRARTFQATVHNLKGSVWIGTFRVSPMRLGKPKQMSSGVKVGRHRFSNAFVATIRGHVGMFRRWPLPSTKRSTGAWSLNLPIEEQWIDLNQTNVTALEAKALRNLDAELAVRLKEIG
ncbi:MAG: hypothetical protein GY799_25390 [Desulfobulbaceae bacterium]|nr:hypothetical protein [Desulfobulbaceae bacterium]